MQLEEIFTGRTGDARIHFHPLGEVWDGVGKLKPERFPLHAAVPAVGTDVSAGQEQRLSFGDYVDVKRQCGISRTYLFRY